MADVNIPQTCTCGQPNLNSPSMHSGTCPVWAAHHNLILLRKDVKA